MKSNKWTDEQLAAIETRQCSLLVSAAAGAGKTAVLVERIIRKICDEEHPIDVDRLLIVTFTKAAAAEMRERISSAISRELNKRPDSRHLHRQLSLLNRASITTLHSFCLDILRKYFYAAELEPNFRVADEAEAALLRLEVLEELFEDYYAASDQGFLSLVDAYGGDRNDLILQEMVLKLYQFASANPWPELWLNNLAQIYHLPEEGAYDGHPYFANVLNGLVVSLDGCRAKLNIALELSEKPGGPKPYRDNLIADMQVIEGLSKAGQSWTEMFRLANTIDFGRLKPCRDKDIDENLKDRVRKIRDEVKATVKKMKNDFFHRDPADLAGDLKKTAVMAKYLADLTLEFHLRFKRAKSEKSLVDFSDLEHNCLQILTDHSAEPGCLQPSKAAYELKEYFHEVLVDEFQDINGVQETILQLISRDGCGRANRFMVGDAKQSIYRFRLADPGLFLQKYHSYPRDEGALERCIDLTCNFRSRREVIEAVNYIFRQIMTPGAGEINYDRKAELVSAADYPELPEGLSAAAGPTELHLLEADLSLIGDDNYLQDSEETQENTADAEPVEHDMLQSEALAVARRIRRMISGSHECPGPEFAVFDHRQGEYRRVQFRDIVVLLRSTRGSANVFLDEFRKVGIPAYADLGTGYFATIEVETVLSLLHIIDNPRQDIPLAAVLRSPIADLTAEDLAVIRLNHKGDYFAALQGTAGGKGVLAGKVREFLKKLDKWRQTARRVPLAQLIWFLYQDTGYYAYAGGLSGGEERQANLRSLYERARQYERTSFRGLFNFLRFITRFRDSGSDMGTAGTVGENEDAVRIMSIHKSKGLEFPVVIIAGLGKMFNMTDLTKTAVIHRELGLGLPVVDLELHLMYPSLAQAAIKQRLRAELLAEEMRVLYVAMTRAREKIILFGSVKKLTKKAIDWYEAGSGSGGPLADSSITAAKQFLDWICPAVAGHPQGYVLRRLAGVDQGETEPGQEISGHESGWIVHVYGLEGIPDKTTSEAGVIKEFILKEGEGLKPVSKTGGYQKEINAILNWHYPWTKAVGKPVKATVTEIKGRFNDPDNLDGENYPAVGGLHTLFTPTLKRPRFISQISTLGPAERGSAVHLVMQHLSLSEDLTLSGIDQQIGRLREKQLLTEEQAAAVDRAAVAAFFRTSLGQRYLKARAVKREVAFTMALPAASLYDDMQESSGEKILIQGIIDCLIDEGDGYVLVDFKTDQVASEGVHELVNRYRGQLNLYSLAVESILGKGIKEKYLYLFSLGCEVKCS